jgi:Phage integrase family
VHQGSRQHHDVGRLGLFLKWCQAHLLRHSITTILLDSGLVPIDQLQKFLGHLDLSTTQIHAEISLRALGDDYIRALCGRSLFCRNWAFVRLTTLLHGIAGTCFDSMDAK